MTITAEANTKCVVVPLSPVVCVQNTVLASPDFTHSLRTSYKLIGQIVEWVLCSASVMMVSWSTQPPEAVTPIFHHKGLFSQ